MNLPYGRRQTRSHITYLFFFFNDTATTEIYTLSLHDALPIWERIRFTGSPPPGRSSAGGRSRTSRSDRKSTRLNSSHANISYAVFCLKKNEKSNGSTINNENHFLIMTAPSPYMCVYL